MGSERETELIDTEGFWGGMIEMIGRGSEVMRHDGSTESAMDIVLKTVKRKLRVVLDIQTQLVDEKRSLDDTDAAQALEAELTRERKRFQEKLDQVQSDMKSALEDHDKEWQQQLEKDKKLYEDKIKKTRGDSGTEDQPREDCQGKGSTVQETRGGDGRAAEEIRPRNLEGTVIHPGDPKEA